jgi:hypothetical protein
MHVYDLEMHIAIVLMAFGVDETSKRPSLERLSSTVSNAGDNAALSPTSRKSVSNDTVTTQIAEKAEATRPN